jgi:hypothetical protein
MAGDAWCSTGGKVMEDWPFSFDEDDVRAVLDTMEAQGIITKNDRGAYVMTEFGLKYGEHFNDGCKGHA